MVRLFLDLFARDFARVVFFEEDFFFVEDGLGCLGFAEVGAGAIGERLAVPDVASDDSLGLIPNMPTIGLVGTLLSDFDIRASESSRRGQHRATNVKLPTEKADVAYCALGRHERW